MSQEEKYEELKSEMRKHSDKIIELEKSQISNDFLVRNFTEVSKKLTKTMESFERTMIGIQISLKDNIKDIGDINHKIDKLDERIQEESEKNKIDVRDINKDGIIENLKKYGVGAISLVGIYKIIELIKPLLDNA